MRTFVDVIRHRGRVVSLVRSDGVRVNWDGNALNADTREAMEWVTANPGALDLSDKQPDPEPVDADRVAVRAILLKPRADRTAADRDTVLEAVARRLGLS